MSTELYESKQAGPSGRVCTRPPPDSIGMAHRHDQAADRHREMVQRVLDEEQHAARTTPGIESRNYEVLWDRLDGNLTGGKRTRPHLVYLAFRAYGGVDLEAVAMLGAGFEMLHAALLMHDDVIDRDFIRRGAPTVGANYRDDASFLGHTRETAEHAGHSASIIAGDILLAGSIRLAALAGASSTNSREILDVVQAAVLASAAGELDDLVFSLAPACTPVAEVLNMERLKTAAYSFEAPLQAGALLGGAAPATAAQLGALGRNIGTAYQIIDDVLGTFGNPVETGKSIDSDLRADKHTVLTAHAGSDPDFQAARAAFAAGSIDISDLRAALAACGAEAQARSLAAELVASALDEAQELELAPTVLDELTDIGDHVLNRRK